MAQILPVTPSLLNKFLTCPKQYENTYITKEFPYQQNEAAMLGDRIHKSVEAALKHGAALTPEADYMQKFVDWCRQMAAQPGWEMHVEKDLAITKSFEPCTWRGTKQNPPYMRGKADVFFVDHNNQLNIPLDWKTGKVKHDKTQANILATCARYTTGYTKTLCMWVFMNYNDVIVTNMDLIDLNPVATTMQDIARYERACQENKFPATPNGLCRGWCDVLSCPHNGKNPVNAGR